MICQKQKAVMPIRITDQLNGNTDLMPLTAGEVQIRCISYGKRPHLYQVRILKNMVEPKKESSVVRD